MKGRACVPGDGCRHERELGRTGDRGGGRCVGRGRRLHLGADREADLVEDLFKGLFNGRNVATAAVYRVMQGDNWCPASDEE